MSIASSVTASSGLPCLRNSVVRVINETAEAKTCRLQLSYVQGCTSSRKCSIAFSPERTQPLRRRFSVSVIAASTNELQIEDGSGPEEKPIKKYAWVDAKKPRICILGGGFGGLYTALQLESLDWPADKKPEVLLVDQSDRFVFKPLMYELLSKEVDLWEVAPPFQDLLHGSSIHFQQDRVKKILPCHGLRGSKTGDATSKEIGGTVILESGLQVEYDWLLLALGAESKRDIVPGAAEHALPFSSLEDVLEIESQLKKVEQKKFGTEKSLIQLVVVGAGYSGVELAATLAERLGDRGKVQVVDVTPDICSSAPVGNREAAYKVLSSRSVELILGVFASGIKRVSVEEDDSTSQCPYVLELRPANKPSKRSGLPSMTLPADLILWTVGSKPALPSDILGIGTQPFPLNGRGQVETDDTLRVKGHPQIFAVGDSAFLRDSSNQPLPATAQVAFQEADYCGWNLWAAINGRPLLPFRCDLGCAFLSLYKMLPCRVGLITCGNEQSWLSFCYRINFGQTCKSIRVSAIWKEKETHQS